MSIRRSVRKRNNNTLEKERENDIEKRINTTSDRKGRDREENSMGIILVIYKSLPGKIS